MAVPLPKKVNTPYNSLPQTNHPSPSSSPPITPLYQVISGMAYKPAYKFIGVLNSIAKPYKLPCEKNNMIMLTEAGLMCPSCK